MNYPKFVRREMKFFIKGWSECKKILNFKYFNRYQIKILLIICIIDHIHPI